MNTCYYGQYDTYIFELDITPLLACVIGSWTVNAAYMVNQIFCDSNQSNSAVQQLTSDAVIEVSISIPFAFRAIPAKAIESTGGQILEQILGQILPRFMAQLVKDYQAWATGDASRQPLGTGEI
ncbi:hypothetical protein OIU84_020513 [Salix udensis]|uniref:DUF1997 domain-containing protein n=1 Tax=Salix udensis TaxID=889485 RepID=A0AAD6PFW7_9ROSI|nr:hypothetical protein OIU84_020513 [Salix udensis]